MMKIKLLSLLSLFAGLTLLSGCTERALIIDAPMVRLVSPAPQVIHVVDTPRVVRVQEVPPPVVQVVPNQTTRSARPVTGPGTIRVTDKPRADYHKQEAAPRVVHVIDAPRAQYH